MRWSEVAERAAAPCVRSLRPPHCAEPSPRCTARQSDYAPGRRPAARRGRHPPPRNRSPGGIAPSMTSSTDTSPRSVSMRPRHKAAENVERSREDPEQRLASMRPRHKAAENTDRGREKKWGRNASMRPRHKAAENRSTMRTCCTRRRCFNEAAA